MARNSKKSGSRFFRDFASHLHVKSHTAGTSNEISLAVLDGLKEKTDLKEEGRATTARLGGVSLFTLSGKKGGLDAKRKSNASESSIGSPLSMASSEALPAPKDQAPALPRPARPSRAQRAAQKHEAKTQRKQAKASKKQQKQQAKAVAARKRALADPNAEIKRRKKMRKLRKILVRSVAAVFVAGVCAFGAYTIHQEVQAHQANVSLVEQGMSELKKADEFILPMDSMVTGDVTDASVKEMNQLKKGVEDAEVHLNAAESFAEEALKDIRESDDKKAAEQLARAAESRRVMMEEALVIMKASANAQAAVNAVDACWDLVLQADSLMKEAAALVTDTTNENTRASQAKSEEARGLLYDAFDKLEEAQDACATADFSALQAYIDKRIESIGYAIASDEAIYLQDKQTADSQNALYNQADAQAVELAKALPQDPAQPVVDVFEANTKASRENYLSARSQAGESDSFMRDYLGEGR